MIPTEPNPPYDQIATLINFLSLGLAGALGATVRDIRPPSRIQAQVISEWLRGVLCSIYDSELTASIIHHILEKFDLIRRNTSYQKIHWVLLVLFVVLSVLQLSI